MRISIWADLWLMVWRNIFAAKALEGMLAHSRGEPPHGYHPRKKGQDWHKAIAEEAFEIAEEMIKNIEIG